VDLQTPRPFDRKGFVGRYTLAGSRNDNDGKTNPRGSLFFSNTWGDFGALVSVAASKANNGNAGVNNSTLQYVAAGLNWAGNGVMGPWDTSTPTGTGGLTLAELNSGMLPRLIRVFGQENKRDRIGVNTSLQYKTDRLNVSLDTLVAKMTDDTRDYFVHWSVSDTVLPGRSLIPVNVRLDENNNLQGTIGNFVQNAFSRTFLSESKFLYNAVNASYKVNDALRLKGQIAMAENDAWRNTALIQGNGDPAIRQTLTLDFSNPLRPTISTDRNLLDRTNINSFVYSGSYVEENDKQRIASVSAEHDWELGSVQGLFKVGANRSESTKGVTALNAPNVLNNYVIPGLNKTYGAATAAEKAAFMQGVQTPNNIPALTRNAGQGYPTEFLVVDRDFVLGELGALGVNKSSPVVAPSTYANTEKVDAFFVQTDLDTEVLGRVLRGNVGVRYVRTKVDIDTVRQATGGNWTPVQLNTTYDDVLPSASFAYDLTKSLVWRGAWGKSLTANRVSDISAAVRLPFPGALAITTGNPELQPERAIGRDTSLEWYPDKDSVVALGRFERRITGSAINKTEQKPFNQLGLDILLWQPIQQTILTNNPATPIDVTTKVNDTNPSTIKGWEFSYSQAFKFLPYPFNGLGGTLSVTKVDSNFEKLIGGQTFGMPKLPPKTYALTMFYETGPFSARAAYSHTAAYANTGALTNTVVNEMNPQGFQRWFNKRDYLDVSVGYQVLKNLQVRLDVINLTKTKTYEYFKRYTDVGQGSATGPKVTYNGDESRIEGGLQAGRTIQLTLRGSF
jgi:iron complex outermembrane recepter protein